MVKETKTYDYQAVKIAEGSGPADPSTETLIQMNNWGRSGFRFVGTFQLKSESYMLMEHEGTQMG